MVPYVIPFAKPLQRCSIANFPENSCSYDRLVTMNAIELDALKETFDGIETMTTSTDRKRPIAVYGQPRGSKTTVEAERSDVRNIKL